MSLRLTLKPGELVVVNGCAIRNADRRQVLVIENQADVVRGKDLITAEEATTPVSRVYLLIQTALMHTSERERVVPRIQQQLGVLATVFGTERVGHVFRAANHVGMGDYYKALAEMRHLLSHEQRLLQYCARRGAEAREEHLRSAL